MNFEIMGNTIRELSKTLVLEFMKATPSCQPGQNGMTQAQIFRDCGFDWRNYKVATSSNQQYWLAAILWELHSENKVERVYQSGPWRLL